MIERSKKYKEENRKARFYTMYTIGSPTFVSLKTAFLSYFLYFFFLLHFFFILFLIAITTNT